MNEQTQEDKVRQWGKEWNEKQRKKKGKLPTAERLVYELMKEGDK